VVGGGKSNMRRKIYEMPLYIAEALRVNKVEAAYRARPTYQQND
jgi:hypothetical protein